MTSAVSTGVDFTGRLSRGLQRVVAARGSEAVFAAAAKAAYDIAGADGLCALPRDFPHYWLVTPEAPAVLSLKQDSAWHRLVASTATAANDAIIQHRPGMEVELPEGRRLRTETILTVPLDPSSAYLAICFFWRDGFIPSSEQLSLLPALACTSSLALRAQQQEEDLQRSHERQRLQILELQHRARNILALVRSIIRRSSSTADSAEYFASHLEGRISALARTQGSLIIDGRAGPELEDLIRAEMTANAVRENQFVLTGPSIRLSTRGTETMALMLHELTTNALKFGALTAAGGLIAVSWSVDNSTSPSRLRWNWTETGVTIVKTTPHRRGFGQELIERVLPYELDARTKFTFAPGGVLCEVDLPLNARTTSFNEGLRETSPDMNPEISPEMRQG